MRNLLAVLLAAAAAAQTLTTVTDTIRTPAGVLFTGRVTIVAPELTWNGQTYTRGVSSLALTNGVMSQTFIPNIGAQPEGTSYRVTFQSRDGQTWSEWWQIPDSPSTPLKVHQVRRSSNPDISTSVPLWRLGDASNSSGKVMCSDGVTWGPCKIKTGGESYTETFTNQTTVAIGAAAHKFSTANLAVRVFDATGKEIWAGITIDQSTYQVTVAFAVAQSGRVVINQAPSSSAAFTSQTTVVITGAVHGLGSAAEGYCFDAAGKQLKPGSVTVNPTTFDVTFAFLAAQTGRCFVR